MNITEIQKVLNSAAKSRQWLHLSEKDALRSAAEEVEHRLGRGENIVFAMPAQFVGDGLVVLTDFRILLVYDAYQGKVQDVEYSCMESAKESGSFVYLYYDDGSIQIYEPENYDRKSLIKNLKKCMPDLEWA